MGIDQFFENINDFDIEELENIRAKILKRILERLAELPHFNDGCCMNQDSEATQEEFEECEQEDSGIVVEELYDENPIFRVRCFVCGGLREEENNNGWWMY